MPDFSNYGLFPRDTLPIAPSITARRAGVLTDAALTLRMISGERTQRNMRDPSCFLPALADALEALAEGDEATARSCMAMWARCEQ